MNGSVLHLGDGSVLYLRVSTEMQVKEGTSMASQEKACLLKSMELNASVVEICRDDGVSGGLYFTREGIQKALSFIEKKQARYLIVAKVDRMGRDVDSLRDIRKRVRIAGGEMVFADGLNFANDAVGNLMFTQMGAFAEFERDLIRDRTMGGKAARARNGYQPCRAKSPWGYHILELADVLRGVCQQEEIGRYRVVEEEAEWVRQVFAWYSEGVSLRQICNRLMVAGVETRYKGLKWYPSTLRFMICNSIYKGEAVHGLFETFRDEKRIEAGFTSVSYRKRNEARAIRIAVTAIVEIGVWDKCQKRRELNSQMFSGNPKRRQMLSGLLICPLCNGKMFSEKHHKNVNYMCRYEAAEDHRALPECSKVRLRVPLVDELLLSGLDTLIKDSGAWSKAIKVYNDIHRKKKKPAPKPALEIDVEAQLSTLLQREEATVRAQIQGIMSGASIEIYASMFEEIKAERVRLMSLRSEMLSVKSEPTIQVLIEGYAIIAGMSDVMGDVLRREDVLADTKFRALSTIMTRVRPLDSTQVHAGIAISFIAFEGIEVVFRPSIVDTNGAVEIEILGDTV